MLAVVRLHLPSDIPIVGIELSPYVLIRRLDSTVTADDIPESSPVDGHFLRYKWFRVQNDKSVAICSIHPSEPATLQCLACLKPNIPVAKSYHCTPKCFIDAWPHHRALHERATNELKGNQKDGFGHFHNSVSSANLTIGYAPPMYPAGIKHGDETWFEVGRTKTYTPTADDIGHALKFECSIASAVTKLRVGQPNILLTNQVMTAPSPTPRQLICVDGTGHLDLDRRGSFTVMSYKVLSETCASNDLYNYCPPWALSWLYRRQNLLREIVGYRADIICLQEVQNDHYDDFFYPELEKHGYYGLFKRKTTEVPGGKTIDGCATFYRRDKFAQVKKYEVEFNKAAQSLTEAGISATQKKIALNRLVKDNVALIVVLEMKVNNQAKKQLICVANTHVHVQQDLKDVKLWQVHTLLKGLEKIYASADIPILVCGDFNSVPGSAPHELLAVGKVDPSHPDLTVDPLNILHPHNKLVHQLPLVSAYTSFARTVGVAFEQHKRRLDTNTNEPLITSVTRDFVGTLDYIFYSADSLIVVSLLELLDEESLRKDTALPSPGWSSDHIALLAEFRCQKSLGLNTLTLG